MLSCLRCSLLTQQPGYTTVRVVSRPGRITQTAHVFVIVRNLLDSTAADKVGRVRLLPTDDQDQQVCPELNSVPVIFLSI